MVSTDESVLCCGRSRSSARGKQKGCIRIRVRNGKSMCGWEMWQGYVRLHVRMGGAEARLLEGESRCRGLLQLAPGCFKAPPRSTGGCAARRDRGGRPPPVHSHREPLPFPHRPSSAHPPRCLAFVLFEATLFLPHPQRCCLPSLATYGSHICSPSHASRRVPSPPRFT